MDTTLLEWLSSAALLVAGLIWTAYLLPETHVYDHKTGIYSPNPDRGPWYNYAPVAVLSLPLAWRLLTTAVV